MCMILFDTRTSSSETIDREILERCLVKNQDGMGIMWPEEDEVKLWRTLDDIDQLWERYCALRAKKSLVALHFRLGTKGTVDIENCHPFQITKDFAFMHNGTITGFKQLLPEGWSDSRFVCEELFKTFPKNFLARDAYYPIMDSLLFKDRMLFLDGRGRYSIFNEKGGVWKWKSKTSPGVWFSHDRYMKYLLTGEIEKEASFNYGNYWSRSDKNPSSKGTNWWENHTKAQPQKGISNKSFKKRKKINLKKSGYRNLVFLYDSFRDDMDDWGLLPDQLITLNTAVAENVSLWALEGGFAPIAGIYPKRNATNNVLGSLYTVSGSDSSVEDILLSMDQMYGCIVDKPEGSLFSRRHIPVKVWINKIEVTLYAWAYFPAEGRDINPRIEEIPSGDWREWYDDYVETKRQKEEGNKTIHLHATPDPFMEEEDTQGIGSLNPHPKIVDGVDPQKCENCLAFDTYLIEDALAGYLNYCNSCYMSLPLTEV